MGKGLARVVRGVGQDFWIPTGAPTPNFEGGVPLPRPTSEAQQHSLKSLADAEARQQLLHANVPHRVIVQLQGHGPLEMLQHKG